MSILRAIAALVLGLVVGSAINMGIIMAGSGVVPLPDGVDPSNPDSLAGAAELLRPQHFVFPFLAHALGTLAGALTGYLVAGAHRTIVAYVIGTLFLVGGIMAATMIPAPVWFVALDLVLAYVPMAYLAIRIARAFGK